MIDKDLQKVLELHFKWLNDEDGGVNANLRNANLRNANLRYADLQSADLRNANLLGADLRNANLLGADLRNANLLGANLQSADLRYANLQNANLQNADLRNADLRNAKLPSFQITPKGFPLYGFKKLKDGIIATLLIPEEAERTASLVGRKCRAEFVKVVALSKNVEVGISQHDGKTEYKVGEFVYPDRYDGDILVECTSGIHFFQTLQEAENY